MPNRSRMSLNRHSGRLVTISSRLDYRRQQMSDEERSVPDSMEFIVHVKTCR